MSGGSVERVRAALLAAGHPDTVASFPDGTRSAAEAAAAVGCTVAQIAKSIVFRAGDRPLLVIASGANRVDMAKAAAALNGGGGPMFHVKRAEGGWVRDVTGFAIGGVAPLGHLTPPLVLLDEELFRHEQVWAAAGSPMHVFATTPDALLRLSGGGAGRCAGECVMLPITAFYAAPLALAFVALATRVIRTRRLYHQPMGTAHRLVERAARAHGNFAEAVPLALLLLALCEANGLPAWALHVLGVTLLAGRGFHAFGIGRDPEVFRWRVLGTSLTLTMIGVAGAAAMGLALAELL